MSQARAHFEVALMLRDECHVRPILADDLLCFEALVGHCVRECMVELALDKPPAVYIDLGAISGEYQQLTTLLAPFSIGIEEGVLKWSCEIDEDENDGDEETLDPVSAVRFLLAFADQSLTQCHAVITLMLAKAPEPEILAHFDFLTAPALGRMH